MSRYHFHQEDGRSYPDKQGLELPSMHAAHTAALRMLTEMVRENEPEFWASGSWRMIVTDHRGLALFCLDLSATHAAAGARACAHPPEAGHGAP